MAKKIIPLKKLTSPGTWVQTERAGHQAWAQLSVQSPRACQLLHLLIAHMDKSGALVASHLTLAGLMKSSVATTKRALAVLTEQAWIQTLTSSPPSRPATQGLARQAGKEGDSYRV
jgi:hypothetical protein